MAYYFGYGSNMSQEYLEKVRNVYPTKSTIAHLKNYILKINSNKIKIQIVLIFSFINF